MSFRAAMVLVGRSGIMCEPQFYAGVDDGYNKLVSPCGLVVTTEQADSHYLDQAEVEIIRMAHIRAHWLDGYGGGLQTEYDSQGQPWTFAIQTAALDGIHHQIVGADPVAIYQGLLSW